MAFKNDDDILDDDELMDELGRSELHITIEDAHIPGIGGNSDNEVEPDYEVPTMKQYELAERSLDDLPMTEDDLGFIFRPQCKSCQVAQKDPEMHKIALATNYNVKEVRRYIFEKHGEDISYGRVKNHLIEHLYPVAKVHEIQRKTYLANIRKGIRERETGGFPNTLDEISEILVHTLENLAANLDYTDMRAANDTARTIAKLNDSYNKTLSSKLQMLGLNRTPEEMQQMIHNLVNKVFVEATMRLDPFAREQIAPKIQEVLEEMSSSRVKDTLETGMEEVTQMSNLGD